MSLKVKETSSAENGRPSVHFTPSRIRKVQLRPSGAVSQLVARSGAGARSLPGLVRPSNRTRLINNDSTKAFGLHGLSVGSATIGMVTVPPATGAPCPAGADAPAGRFALVHADIARAVTKASAAERVNIHVTCAITDLPDPAAAESSRRSTRRLLDRRR